MGIRTYNPTSPGRRNASVSDFAELSRGATVPKHLKVRQKKTGGRNNQGKITSRHRGGGHKQQYRLIDFRRNKDGIPGKVESIQYDPNRTCRVALVFYADGEKRFILSPEGLLVGATVLSGPESPPEVGNCLPFSAVPLGTQVHNIELQQGRGGRLCRSAGSSAVLVARESLWAQITLPSGEIRRVVAATVHDEVRVGGVDGAGESCVAAEREAGAGGQTPEREAIRRSIAVGGVIAGKGDTRCAGVEVEMLAPFYGQAREIAH